MLRWARQFEQRRWAVENAEGLGRHLSSWLLARESRSLTCRQPRLLGCGSSPAAGAARTTRSTLRPQPASPRCRATGVLAAEGITDALALLDESRMNLAQTRVRLVNQLHALLRELLAGGARKDLSATAAAELLRRVRPAGDVERVRKQIAAGPDHTDPLRRCAAQVQRQTDQRARRSVGKHSDQHRRVGTITAGRLIGRTGRAAGSRAQPRSPTTPARRRSRWPAPKEPDTVSPAAETVNSTPHCTPSHHPDPNAGQPRPCLLQRENRPRENGPRSATVLKRRLADHIWRTMITDQRRVAANPGGHSGATLQSSAAGSTPTASSSDKSLPRPAIHDTTTPRPAT